jgi:hypothetical protein
VIEYFEERFQVFLEPLGNLWELGEMCEDLSKNFSCSSWKSFRRIWRNWMKMKLLKISRYKKLVLRKSVLYA